MELLVIDLNFQKFSWLNNNDFKTKIGNMCISKTNCKECISSIHSCGWCLQNVWLLIYQNNSYKYCKLILNY